VTEGDAVKPVPRDPSIVLVDSSALLYLVEGSPRRREAVERFIEESTGRGARLIASTIAWVELLEKPLASGEGGLADRYRGLLADSGRLELCVLDAAIAERAAALGAALPRSARRALSQADLVHIATALVAGAEAILGNDEAWREVPGCPPLLLVDELAFDP
jgi:predicted nucleic acid-binding protein